MPAAAGDELGREFAHPPLGQLGRDTFEAAAAVDPRPASAHHEDVGDGGVADQRGEFLVVGGSDVPGTGGARRARQEGRVGTVSVHATRQ
ncbi:hypothetical protein P9139_18275 [Curtobacterium flaccumfaciens]|nr:hypothetical protein P9139_18275 [Curtobacterium flaccumfaciens]